jgi:Ca2+/Na+ antiporter
MFSNKEMRDLVFMVAAIFVSVLICITTMVSSNIFGIVTSIILLAMLCVGLGYQYCKNEQKIVELLAADKKEKAEKEKATQKSEFSISNDIIENIVDKSEKEKPKSKELVLDDKIVKKIIDKSEEV